LAAFVHSQQVWHACAGAAFALLVQQDCCTFCTAALQHLAAGCGRLASPTATHAAASANDVAIILFMSFLLSVFLPSWQPAQQPDNLASTPRIISHLHSKKIALYNFFLTRIVEEG
jgi:hypothetical protein